MGEGRIARDRHLVGSLTLLLALGGCVDSRTPSPTVPASSASLRPAPSDERPTDPEGPSARPSPDDRSFVAADDRLSLSVVLDSDVIAPGGTVVATATVRNDRPGAVTLGSAWCSSAVDMAARFAIPTEPVGRTWGGIEGEWKEFALTSGLAPGGGPADEGVTIHGTSGPGCDPVERTLGSGESLTVRSLLTADIVDGVPAAPGEVPVEITVLHDPVDPPPRPAPASGPPLPHFGLRMGPTWSQLAVRASIRIEGEAPHVLSLGEAVDALLVDRRFATWLATMPAYTWSVSNVFLGNNGKAEGIAPAGPSWELDLFREAGVARNWAIGFVDPFSGQVLNLAFCNVPCDR